MFLVYLSLLQLIHAISFKPIQKFNNIRIPYESYKALFTNQSFSKRKEYIFSSLIMLICAIILNIIPFIIMKNRKQKSRLLLFFVVPGFSELYTIISILHLYKIIANGIYDMSNPIWNKSFSFN